MFQSKKGRLLIGLTVILFFIAVAYYTTARAQVANADEVVKMVNDWKARKAKDLKHGQWVHMVYSVTSENRSGVILPDEQMMPSSYTQEDWYYINKDGLVEKGVFSMKDNDGNIFQQSAYQNNTYFNLTFGERMVEDQPPYPFNFDFGVASNIMDAKAIKKSDEKVKGKSRVVYSYIETLKLPTQLGQDDVIVDTIMTKDYFDKESGDFVQTETIWTLANGAQIVDNSVEIISIDGFPDAPDEILKVLEEVK
ncbi:MAG: hypothetical protein PHQ36_01530 [Anaerolineales bacterium]|nr:hypothetical protein [Anaerolineales bacterium]